MKEPASTNRLVKNKFEREQRRHQYSSVEFSVNGLCVPHRFRIRNSASTPMCVLVKKNSGILPMLKEGDTWNLKYYPSGSVYSTKCLKTAIRHVTKHDQGPFKGHYLVGLEILGHRNQKPD